MIVQLRGHLFQSNQEGRNEIIVLFGHRKLLLQLTLAYSNVSGILLLPSRTYRSIDLFFMVKQLSIINLITLQHLQDLASAQRNGSVQAPSMRQEWDILLQLDRAFISLSDKN